MKRLILMRHAKSDWSLGTEDHARPLNARGRRSADNLGLWLKREGYRPDQVLSSDSMRTRETLTRLDLELDTQIRFEQVLYLAEPRAMLDCLRDATGDTVLLLGHNPGICVFAHDLVGTPPRHARFEDYPTGATLVADFDIAAWDALQPGTGHSVDFVIPREFD